MKSMPSPASLFPGLNMLQGLAGQAGKGLSNIGQWVSPTLDPAELDKRIEELRTVQFWLEQNAKVLATTIQALEVQKMTLTTLQSMNLKVPDLQQAMKTALGPRAAADSGADADAKPAAKKKAGKPAAKKSSPAAAPATAPAAPLSVDAMAWWNALTDQFSQLASQAAATADGAASAVKSAASTAASTAASSAATTAATSAAKAALSSVAQAVGKAATGGAAASPLASLAPRKRSTVRGKKTG